MHDLTLAARCADRVMLLVEGEVVAMMDVGETPMGPGDVLIQRGTNHAWSNRTDKACRIAFVLIDAQE